MNELIKWHGWFVYTISGLASGDPEFVQRYIKGDLPVMLGEKGLRELFLTLQHTGISRTSRRGWQTIDHPVLGVLQWKVGVNFRCNKNFMFIRLNGQEIVHLWRTSDPILETKGICPCIPDNSTPNQIGDREFVGRAFFHAQDSF